ncbi:MAG: DNA-3-methyladenine glycosylase [Chloroflexi bacterium]|nr:DNA-3-methyladenine glycosylase [Chloroflexota bacterium]
MPGPGSPAAPLPRAFYQRPTQEVARDLLGRDLTLSLPDAAPRIGRIVETEAYLGELDRACHAWRGQTQRTAPMYEESGHAYIYLIYGMYWCLNVVTEEVGQPCAVLLRAVEPIAGLALSADGPGKLCRAFGLNGAWNRADLTVSPLGITPGEPIPPENVGVSPRIGVDYAGEWALRPLRYFIRGNRSVSGARSPRSRRGGRKRSLSV